MKSLRYLAEATLYQLDEVVSAIGASAAVFEYRDQGYEILALNNEYARMIGQGDARPASMPCHLPDYIPRYLVKPFESCLDQVHTIGQGMDSEFPFDRDASTDWWRCSFTPIINDSGEVARIFCLGIDITDKYQLRLALDQSRDKLEALVESAYDGIITCESGGAITTINESACNIFGYQSSELIGKSIHQLIPDDLRDKHVEYVEFFARSPIRSRIMRERTQVYGRRKDGKVFPAEVSISKTKTETGLEFSAIVRDQTEKLALIERLTKEAATDFLTGLHNRRSFVGRLREDIIRSRRYGRPLSVILLDIDDFKTINDTRGHDTGDKVLKSLSNTLSTQCRDTDLVARMGGEEFCVLCPETGPNEAFDLAERIRKTLETTEIVDGLTVTSSFGIASLDELDVDAGAPDRLLNRADHALYRAKSLGKNQVTASQPGPMSSMP